MNKDYLVEKILQSGILRVKNQAEEVVHLIVENIKEGAKQTGEFRIAGLGIFKVKKRKGRIAFNPRTREEVSVPAQNVVKFTPALAFKEFVK